MRNPDIINLRRVVREAVNDLLADGGLTTGQLILRLNEDHVDDIVAAKDELSQIGLRQLVSDIMSGTKKPAVHADQETFRFTMSSDLGEILAPDAITIPVRSNDEPDSVRWVPFKLAKIEDLEAHLSLLETSIAHDKAKAREMRLIVSYFRKHMRKRPNFTVEQVVKALRAKDDKAA